jgi:endoglucanase
MQIRSSLLGFALVVGIVSISSPSSSQTSSGQTVSPLPAQRLSHLRRGINLSEWFAQVYDPKGYSKEHLQSWTTVDDIVLIQKMGFDHVRLSIDPAPMFRHGHADEIPADYLGYLDSAVKMILDHGLAVVLDIHPDGDFKQKLVQDAFVEEFTDYWRAFAKHYAALDPERVFFEILNEPEMQDRYRWYGVESKLAAAIRDGAPQHTIIATGARWSDNDDLIFLDPLRDPNVIYNFHFYEPHIFTHQGATWGVNYWHFLHGLSYPSNPASAAVAAANIPDEANRLPVIRYGMDHWDATRIDTEIAQVDTWAREHGVVITCNEFGVYRKADPADRERWLADVRTALEKHNMGWAMWDYSGGFGIVSKANGKALVDEPTVKALGLKMP